MNAKLLAPLASFSTLVGSSGALACGGGVHGAQEVPRGDIGDFQLSLLMAAMIAAPILAALLVDRGAFALAGYANGLKRRHQPSAVGPMLAVVSVVLAVGAVTARDFNLAMVGFAVVPVAAAACAVSFVRSVIIDLRGQPAAQALRVSAVVLFVALAVARTLWL